MEFTLTYQVNQIGIAEFAKSGEKHWFRDVLQLDFWPDSQCQDTMARMRNVFDQYSQPENRLTHALLTALDQDRSLLVPFLKWLGIKDVPKPTTLTIVEQSVPGDYQPDISEEEAERRGLPDGESMTTTNGLFCLKVRSKRKSVSAS